MSMEYIEEETFEETQFDVSIWKKMFRFLTPLKKEVIISITFAVFLALSDVLYPLLNRYGIDTIIASGSLEGLPLFLGAYIVYMFILGFMVFGFIHFAGKIETHLAYYIREKAFKKLHELPYSYYDKTPVGWIMARMTSDSRKLSDILAWGLIDFTWGGLMMIGLTVAMFIVNWQLALLVVIFLPILLYLSIFFRSKILKAYRSIRKTNSKITGSYNESLGGAKTTKTLVLEDQNYQDFTALTDKMRKNSIRVAIFSGLYFPSIIFVSSLATAVIIYYGGIDVSENLITIGTLYVFINYVLQFFDPVMQLANILARFQEAQASAERILSLIEEPLTIDDTHQVKEIYGSLYQPKNENWETLKGKVTFEDVTFKYDNGETILEHFNLNVKEGESIALVGQTGAGKSTIVNLICRFYEPSGGMIKIDDKDVQERSVSWLHSNLGYVLQDPHLFSGTIRENIRYGRLEASDDDVEKAAKMVDADQFIQTFENGYDTEVGEGGSRLSVGQKQLISFARALLAKPKILILDEATSSVDMETESSIQKAIDIVMKGRTSFVIAHRLSTIVKADRILVLENGQIIESGPHSKLINAGGHYQKLYMNQFKKKEEAQLLER